MPDRRRRTTRINYEILPLQFEEKSTDFFHVLYTITTAGEY
jgi:hypothetical protein